MTLVKPVYSGGDSIVGITRESTWGTTPVGGANQAAKIFFRAGTNPAYPAFIPMKEENIQVALSVDPQEDDMNASREISRIIQNGALVQGGLRLNPGPDSLGYFLTGMFGTPSSSTIQASAGTVDGAYQHIWYPEVVTRANWPVPFSIESRLSDVRSKLIQGAILRRMGLDVAANGVMTATPDFLAKLIVWLNTTASGTTDQRGNTRPCVVTASPTILSETQWHFKHITAYPQIDSVDEEMLTSISFDLGFSNVEGLFTGGSGIDIGSYRVDNFRANGKATVQFENDDLWEDFVQNPIRLDLTMTGDTIVGVHKNSLAIAVYSAYVDTNDVVNRVGNLEYDFGWVAREDPTSGKSIQITIINTTPSYAVNS